MFWRLQDNKFLIYKFDLGQFAKSAHLEWAPLQQTAVQSIQATSQGSFPFTPSRDSFIVEALASTPHASWSLCTTHNGHFLFKAILSPCESKEPTASGQMDPQ